MLIATRSKINAQAAVCNGHMDIIEVLLEHSVDVDQQDMNTGCTPLHVASQWGYTEITKLLIGSLLTSHTQNLALCYEVSETSCIVLSEHKASIEEGLWDTEETPIYVAALEGNVECFRVRVVWCHSCHSILHQPSVSNLMFAIAGPDGRWGRYNGRNLIWGKPTLYRGTDGPYRNCQINSF